MDEDNIKILPSIRQTSTFACESLSEIYPIVPAIVKHALNVKCWAAKCHTRFRSIPEAPYYLWTIGLVRIYNHCCMDGDFLEIRVWAAELPNLLRRENDINTELVSGKGAEVLTDLIRLYLRYAVFKLRQPFAVPYRNWMEDYLRISAMWNYDYIIN